MLTSVREVQHHVDEVHDAMDARAMPATRLLRIVDELSARAAEYSRNPSVIHVAFSSRSGSPLEAKKCASIYFSARAQPPQVRKR